MRPRRILYARSCWGPFLHTNRVESGDTVLNTPPKPAAVEPGRRLIWPRWVSRKGVLFGLGLVLIAITFRPVVEGDGVGYYAYLHAVLVSRSLDFTNEYSAAIASGTPLYIQLVTTRTGTGHLANFFPVGPAVLSTPAFLVALVLHPSGEPQYGSPFTQAFTLASLLYGLLGSAICYRLASSITVSRRAGLLGVAGATLATPLVYYLLSDPSYSHTFSVFCVSAFLYAWWVGPPTTAKGWFGLGLLGGLMAMTRFQDGLIVAVVMVDARRLRWQTILLLPGLLLGFAPQIVADQVQFGTFLPQRPPGQGLDLIHGHYLDIFFSSYDGLFMWTPAALLAAAGYLFVKDRRMKLACAIAFLLEAAVIGSAPDSVGRAFGDRRFLDMVPFAAVGIAAIADRLGQRWDWPVVGAFVAWNLTLLASFEYVIGSGNDPGYAGLFLRQATAVAYVPRLFTKGAVVRDLLLWSQAHIKFDPVAGLLLLALEGACVAVALFVATHRPRPVRVEGRL